MTTSPLTPLQQAVTQLETQAKADLLVPINATLANIIATPDTQEAVAQWPALQAQILALSPILEKQGITDIAVAIQNYLNNNSILAPAPATAAAPATTVTATSAA